MSEQVSFADIPGNSKLFLDFVYNFPAVSAFYSPCGARPSDLSSCIRQVLLHDYPRTQVADALFLQNRAFRAGAPTQANIEKLRQAQTVAVVTGQQIGLFTGPLLTIYKALTAIKVAHHLTANGFAAVPVFWMAAEDHDFKEISSAHFLNRSGQLESLTYKQDPEDFGRGVGYIRLNQSIRQLTDRLLALLPTSESSQAQAQDILATYAPDTPLLTAFARLLLRILGRYGLILLNPWDEALKALLYPLFEKILLEARSIEAAIHTRSQALQTAGFESQVRPVKSNTLLFCERYGRRQPVRMDGDRDFLIGSDSFSQAALLDHLRRNIDSFSPNVLLRPLVQDTLLPTAVYIGGGAEIAYYAQVQPLYLTFGRSAPVLRPRAGFTLIPKKVRRTLEKYQLSLGDLKSDFDSVFNKVLATLLPGAAPERFARAEAELRSQLSVLEALLLADDPSMASAVNHAREKMLGQLETLKKKFLAGRAARHEVASRQIEQAWVTLFPRQTAQERLLNGYTFFSQYGYGILDTIYDAIAVWPDHHTVLDL